MISASAPATNRSVQSLPISSLECGKCALAPAAAEYIDRDIGVV